MAADESAGAPGSDARRVRAGAHAGAGALGFDSGGRGLHPAPGDRRDRAGDCSPPRYALSAVLRGGAGAALPRPASAASRVVLAVSTVEGDEPGGATVRAIDAARGGSAHHQDL